MEAYQASRNEVTKLRMKHPEGLVISDVLWPKKLLYRAAESGQVQNTVEALKATLIGKKGAAAKNSPRFIMSTDGDEFLAIDLKTSETPSFDRLADLPVNYDFLLPMFGVERYKPAPETAADVRAARHMAKFHDAIKDANPTWGAEKVHDLNLFMTRLLFCMFAEDTGIFADKLFVNTIRREAMEIDGGEVKRVIEDIFLSLDIADKENRTKCGVRSQRIAADFPYVNGGLFRDRTEVPCFNRRARRLLLEAADLQWDQIHADIFGSMIQAIVQTDMRADFGMHYTSVPNIMKVLEPLFLNSLREQLTAAEDNVKALERLVDRISRIRVFDPACGSGNFLIIAYRELRLIETEAFRRMRDVKRKGQLALADYQTGIKISSFCGIDPVDFACETAKLSLWISQYQMNRKLDEICSAPTPALPLTDGGSIVVGNALRVHWEKVCPSHENAEIYVVGNPPYLGSALQTDEQKEDMQIVFHDKTKSYKKLDYVACWYQKAAEFNKHSGAKSAFVATNSICQGEQVCLLWPLIYKCDQDISFAHRSFKWRNNAANNAGVSCIIVGIENRNNQIKRIFDGGSVSHCSNINPYLANAPTVIVTPIGNSSYLPPMVFGNQILDGGHLTFSDSQKSELIAKHPESEQLFKIILGSKELIQGGVRHCLWITEETIALAKGIPEIARRLDKVKEFRGGSPREGTNAYAAKPHLYPLISSPPGNSIVVPRVSSENRPYLPAGFATPEHIVPDSAFTIPNAPTWLLSLISSKLHLVWAKAVGGSLETRLRYSNTLVYNTFPISSLSSDQKADLEDYALQIIRAREPHLAGGKTIAMLYNPEMMPVDLLQTHNDLDDYLETIYLGRPFKDDAERLEHLFKLYARINKPR